MLLILIQPLLTTLLVAKSLILNCHSEIMCNFILPLNVYIIILRTGLNGLLTKK